MRIRGAALIFAGLAVCLGLAAARLMRPTATEAKAARFATQDTTAYALPTAELGKAMALGRIERRMEIAGAVWTPAVLLLLLVTGAAARMRDVVVRLAVPFSGSRWVQGFGFVFLVLLAVRLLELPLEIYGHWTALRYGLSVQGWGSWLGDLATGFALDWGIGGLIVMLLMEIVRRRPKLWWLWFWIPAAACVVAGVFVSPYVIDPIFNRFEPLEKADPALVGQLERVAARGGLAIPPERMFLMRASAKSTELNAYVTGFGASKRVVVWDTTVAKSSPDEIALIFAHEMGHYALGHVALGVALSCAGLLPMFWLGDCGVRVLLRRYGAAWRIPSGNDWSGDWGALVVLALVLSVVGVLSDPIANGISRAMEHNADVYGQEAVHGIVADPQAVGQRSFEVLGEDSLDDPTPHPLFEWWFDTHPTMRFRAAFAEAYDPWAKGEHAKYFAR